jgi:histidinol-phosphate/aromatic aminotransferase/cobyric acid decarboxylase-like protein
VHFCLLPVHSAAAWQVALLERRILVRDCASFGLPRHIRIATRSVEDNSRLLAALSECKEELCQDVY